VGIHLVVRDGQIEVVASGQRIEIFRQVFELDDVIDEFRPVLMVQIRVLAYGGIWMEQTDCGCVVEQPLCVLVQTVLGGSLRALSFSPYHVHVIETQQSFVGVSDDGEVPLGHLEEVRVEDIVVRFDGERREVLKWIMPEAFRGARHPFVDFRTFLPALPGEIKMTRPPCYPLLKRNVLH